MLIRDPALRVAELDIRLPIDRVAVDLVIVPRVAADLVAADRAAEVVPVDRVTDVVAREVVPIA